MRRANQASNSAPAVLGLLLILVATFALPAAQARVVLTFPPAVTWSSRRPKPTPSPSMRCARIKMSLDGDTGEWAGLTPMHPDRLTASTIAGADPNPTTADLSADSARRLDLHTSIWPPLLPMM